MSPAEIAHRVHENVQDRLDSRFRLDPAVPQPSFSQSGHSLLATVDDRIEASIYLEEADALLSGKMRVFAKDDAPFPPIWNRDPKTGRDAPTSFGRGINYRHETVVGDIKYLWEPNRHQEMVTLAQAWRLSNDEKYLEAVGALISSWLDECPFPYGVNWTSSLELALRLVNWSMTWDLIGGLSSALFTSEEGLELRSRWLESIYLHQDFIARHLSYHSSANNHILGEYLGLYVAATRWPYWNKSAGWKELGREGFEREALLQTSDDGVNREQAVYYQHEVMDMMLVAGLLARAGGSDFSPAYWRLFEEMCEFLAAVMDTGGNVPMIGDADDARIARLDPDHHSDPYAPLLAAGAIIFDRGDFGAKARRLDPKTLWLMPGAQLPATEPMSPKTSFKQGGYYILGDRLEEADEIRMVCDCGPLGYLSIAAHGHADALAFTLSEGGIEWIVDPGTFAYHTEKKWRDHFRSTLAHNTVSVDGEDQSVIGGNFMWMRKANATLTAFDFDAGVLSGSHDGYTRLADPVRHHRKIMLDRATRTVSIEDTFECAEEHHLAVSFQLAEACKASVEDGAIVARQGGRAIRISCEHPDFLPSLHFGEESPPAGWVSRRFDEKGPAYMARFSGKAGAGTVRTVIELARPE